MFDKLSDTAERLATNVSRRDFFGWAGKRALALTGVIGGILALPSNASAGAQAYCWCCVYPVVCGTYQTCAAQPPSIYCSLIRKNCSSCREGARC
jgi:hypothetical protein